ncbi:hypothetical protein [Litchfieldia salsa]|uniref:Uncharacterized protein n=1 Tax=Litchfieldia salsa TaxID=930152 RepID=A0A1H0S7B4_9BACI|nr:hypothetical protein [Litchfieldia salsa]SDP37429.1 hypothetical protein SAMN05216565_102571 [Litchfieldia salsa]
MDNEKEKEQVSKVSEVSEVSEISEKDEAINYGDPFTRMMFGANSIGRFRENHQDIVDDKPTADLDKDSTQQQIDYNQYYQLMQQVDDIIGTVERMKPVFRELSPLLDFFKKWK